MIAASATALRRVRAAPPASIPALSLVAVFVVWATDNAGYPMTSWAPGALLAAVLLAMVLLARAPQARTAPRAVLVACGALGLFCAWSYASILWAGSPGDAWEGANRTLLYLVIFILFALWRQHAGSAAVVLGAWTLAIAALALIELLQIRGSGPHSTLFLGGRLADPAGYPNASAALWLEALVPAIALSALRELHPLLRGTFTAAAVLLLEVAALSQSRGSIYALPIVLVLLFALVPGRVRGLLALLPVAVAVGVSMPTLLRVGDAVTAAHTSAAVRAALAGAALAGLLACAAAWLERRRPLRAESERRVHRALGAGGLALAAAGVIAAVALAGNPVQRVDDAWHSFKHGYAQRSSGSRLAGGLGSNRYDFYRVALDVWLHHPVNGVGADNFNAQYLLHGRSEETPRYPHSLELRTLSQTGIVGALALLAAIAAALGACAQALRRQDPLARGVVAGAAGVFVYWLVHGSFDWFWEFAGLGAPAWAMLGLACSLAPPRRHLQAPAAPSVPRRRRALAARAALLGVLAAGFASLLLPWLAQREAEQAARIWPRQPGDAYASLRRAAHLNPLAAQPYLLAGSIALRFSDLARAQSFFAQAHRRTPRDAYANLELAAIASARGERVAARALFARAQADNPRDPLTHAAAEVATAGRKIDLGALNNAILNGATRLTGR